MDHGWIGRRCDTVVDVSPPCDVERTPETEVETIPVCVLNGRSPTPPAGERLAAPAAFLAEAKDGWSPEATSHRGSWDTDGTSDAWSSVASVPGLDDNRTEVVSDGERDRERRDAVADCRATIIVVSDSSPTPPPSTLAASSEPPRKLGAALSPAPESAAAATAFDESVVRKLESFVESMNVRRCAKPTTIGWTDAVTSSTSGLGRPSFPACRPLQPLNGLRGGGGGSGVLVPFYVPFKASDAADRPLDLSSKDGRTSAAAKIQSTAAFAQVDDAVREARDDDDGISSLESLQKQFGENSAMLDRIGVRRQTVSGVAPLAGVGARIHGAASPLNGVGLYGPALNEPCVPPSCRPVHVPQSDAPSAAGRCPPTAFDAARSLPADRRSARRLVRGQDAWMNGVSGRQRRSSVLRCLECNMSFWSLPELTLHMIKTAHYANIVRASVVPGPTPEMTSSPTVASSCSPVDSDSSRESDLDSDRYFRPGVAGSSSSDFRLAKSAKRQRDSSTSGDDYSRVSKIWRPDCPLPAAGHCPATVDRPAFHTTSADGRATPVCEDPSGLEHDRAVTLSKSPEDLGGAAAPLYDRSAGRFDDIADDGGARQPALTAMEDFISRSICELDRSKRRPAMPLLAPPTPAPRPPPPNGIPPSMTVADLMFPFFPLAQFFPEQFLIASRAFNFLPLMQSMARLYGDRFAGPDLPLGASAVHVPSHKATTGDELDAAKRPSRQRTPTEVDRSPDRRADSLKCQRVNGGEAEIKTRARDRHDNGPIRATSDGDGLRGIDDRRRSSPSSSDVDGLKSTALDSLRGFVYGDRKQRSEHARGADRKYFGDGGGGGGHVPARGGGSADEAAARRRPRQSPSVSSGCESIPAATSPTADVAAPETATTCGAATDRTNDYDSRFDKYYRLARELAGQL